MWVVWMIRSNAFLIYYYFFGFFFWVWVCKFTGKPNEHAPNQNLPPDNLLQVLLVHEDRQGQVQHGQRQREEDGFAEGSDGWRWRGRLFLFGGSMLRSGGGGGGGEVARAMWFALLCTRSTCRG